MKHLATFRIVDAIARTGSIRAAAEMVAQTPSAVQRRLQGYEEELGYEIFERSSRGVRLNAAGELVIQHVRAMLADDARLKSRIADLSGVRRGHVAVGCSQALSPYFLPAQIAEYLEAFPSVTFDVSVLEHGEAARALESYAVDLALVFDGEGAPDFEVLLTAPQRLTAVMAADHPLAAQPEVRLRDCCAFPLALPVRGFGGRRMVDRALYGKTFARAPSLESNSFEYLKAHVAATRAVTFQIGIGAPRAQEAAGLAARRIDERDVPPGALFLGQKPGRTLPVAASRFAEQLTGALSRRYALDAV
ncbi:LysR family transcriptional regulator [Rhodovulum sp. DZ06]|uniref:LysR family transcriptional regulator n=1 Tax=Rhodovulum sp. DZ06 TaxID=3425126 RepID=UPI003D33A7F2